MTPAEWELVFEHMRQDGSETAAECLARLALELPPPPEERP